MMHPKTAARLARLAALALPALLSCAEGGSAPITQPPVSCGTTPPSAVAAYYATTVNKCGSALLAALHDIIDNQRLLDYTQARDSLYAFVDRGDAAGIVDIYTGRSVPGVTSRATAVTNGINTEHIWPQSLGADLVPGESDLHHLAASDTAANSKRSNNPFGIVGGTVLWTSPNASGVTGEVSRLGYLSGSSGLIVFEPRPSKRGDVARAILYFYVRYNAERPTGFSLANFAVERTRLLQWHAADPPDAYERARNEAVFRAQGNRNPFIDWPELVTLIGNFPTS